MYIWQCVVIMGPLYGMRVPLSSCLCIYGCKKMTS